MSDWFDGQLADSIAALNAGVSVNAEDRPHGSGEIGVLKTSAVSGGQFLPDQNKTVVEHERRLVAEPVQGDSILVSRMNTPALVGESCYVREAHPSLFLPDRLWQLKPKDSTKISMRWMSFVLQSAAYRRHVEVHATGTSGSMKNLPKSKLLALPISYPGLTEQAQIAQILDTLDTAIFETESIIAKLKAVKQGLLHDLLTRGIDANGELRPPQAEAPHLYKESPLGWIPQDWDTATLESVSSTVTSGSRDWARYYSESGALFVRIGNLTREHINFRFDSTIYVRPPRNADGQRTRLEPGDILISITADLGIVGVIPEGMGEAYINQHIAVVRPSFSAVNPRFVGHYLACPVAQIYISQLNDAGAKAGLNLPTVRGLLTVRPERREQDLIAERLDEIDKRIQNAAIEVAKLRELKAGLMDDLLTGRVRVTPLLEAAAP
ncbi:restriction endonuclease subunit S [Malikia spinosa]|uniref:Restriction endonuclease subunit S n=1 Tax=Malikia spinosa TaxID=86180 RepID=A0A2S9KE28_9BURK|nr:restriction endonuclease subunit S [Malikia spinosa]PRD68693.1 restriction endonuclease subunit S [Malikia spinosa]